MTARNEARGRTGLEIAVIGMALRFPGARNAAEFWENLKNGVESITFFSDGELEAEDTEPEKLKKTGYVKAKGILQDIEYFDSSFFGYTPKEAEVMDPQIRIFHECAWEALEDAGYDPGSSGGLIGLYAGSAANVFWAGKNFIQARGGADKFSAVNLNSNFFSTLISYKLNLKGSSLTVQTACSTSLVAIHTACRSLLTGEVDMALAGGITVNIPQKTGYHYQEGMILSVDGHCRAFDAESTGTIGGEGVGIVVLKPLVHALNDGDYIHAVIIGSAVNNDGDRKVGYTAPSVEGQLEVITSALEMAEVEPESITYVETHGTGTSLGDPIEIEALKLAFNTDKKGFCRIGSVKTNVGHLDCASGAAGFIKAVQALKHRLIPPSLHFKNPNPKIDFENSPFYVSRELSQWKRNDDTHPLRAGVSSFGIGGTNAHVILEEWPEFRQPDGQDTDRPQLILLSAKTLSALDRATRNLGEFFKKNPGINLANAAYTLQVGRGQFKHRRTLVCRYSDMDEAVDALESVEEQSLHTFFAEEGKKHVVFMFPGQGSQYVNMGVELYRTEPVFREEMNRCSEILKPLMGYDLKEILYPAAVSNKSYKSDINQTEITQPVIFAIEYALARLLMKWGIKPDAMTGHSIGEYVAACLAGVFSLEDALRLVALRGKLMQSVPPGSMLSVPLSEDELKPLLPEYSRHEDIALAAINTSRRCVVSGPREIIKGFAALLEDKGYKTRMLHTSHAFHSRMMDPVLPEFEKNVGRVTLNIPQIPYISNVTGTWITAEQAGDPGYWADHLRRTVQFSAGLSKLLESKNAVFVEIGPGKVLSTFVRQHTAKLPEQPVLNLVRHPDERVSDTHFLLEKMGRLWGCGLKIDWHEFHGGEKRSRIPLPTYPFEKQRFSVGGDISEIFSEMQAGSKAVGERLGMDEWFYVPSWKRVDVDIDINREEAGEDCHNWIVFIDDCGVGLKLAERLNESGQDVTLVKAGKQFKKQDGSRGAPVTFVIDPGQPGHYNTLFEELSQSDRMPQRIVHLWGVTGKGADEPDSLASVETGMGLAARIEYILDTGFYSLLNTARAVGQQDSDKTLRVDVVTDNLQEVVGSEELQVEKAPVLGAVRVIPKEYPRICCRSIDIELPAKGNPVGEKLVRRLKTELHVDSSDRIVALRGRHRWVQHFEPVHLDKPKSGLPRLKKRGVYLITGGFGGMGLTFAGNLAETLQARLILVDQLALPPRKQWQDWLNSSGSSKDSRTIYHIRKVQELENHGADVLTASADITDYQQMKDVFRRAVEQFGSIDGVFHTAGIGDYAGVIHLRTQEQSEAILAPKLKGTLVLDKLLADTKSEPDFLVFCSSLSSFIAPFGQVAYTAANAFLDSFAIAKNLKSSTFTASINWDSWRDVGMAVEAVEKFISAGVGGTAPTASQPEDVDHPLFDGYIEENPQRRIFVSGFRPDKHWVLDEHRILGKAVLPGTAYLEMARAAVEHYVGNTRMEMKDMYFLNPLVVDDEEEKEVHTILENREGENEFEFSIISRGATGEDKWQTHARGKVSTLNVSMEPSTAYHIEELEAGCNEKEKSYTEKNQPVSGGFISAGPRWENFKRIKTGNGQGMALLELMPAFAPDTRHYKLHPALLDAAVSFLVENYHNDNPYLPFSFKRIRINAPLPTRIYSHSTYIEDKKNRGKNQEFNVVIMDEQGVELVNIEGFTLVAVSKDRSADLEVESFEGYSGDESPEQDPLKNAIRPAEGVEVILRILSAAYPQVLVSTTDFPARYEQAENFNISGLDETLDLGDKADSLPSHPRPELSSAYAAPGNETEQALANIWQGFFGIQQIGVFDDFFELGGDSLKALSLVTTIQKEFLSDVSLTDFFNSPTIRGMAAIIDKGGKSIYSSIEPTEEKEYYVLSSAQKRMYFLQQLDLESTSYNIPTMVILEGKIDRQKFESTFGKLIRRHESLRTSFRFQEKTPVQIVHPEVAVKVEYYEEKVPDITADEIIQGFIRPFDLSRAPLMRVGLLRIVEEKHILMIDMHHIATDATSVALLTREFMVLYSRPGKELPGLTLQYRDYALWQADQNEKGTMKQQEEYWLNEFSGEIPVLELPVDYARPAVKSFAGSHIGFEIGKGEMKELRSLVSREEVTLFMLLLALFNVLLSKISGQEDIVIGAPVAGRSHAELQQIIGMFVGTLALRNFPGGEKTFSAFLQEVKKRTLAAFENQDYQLEDIVDRLGIKRDISRNPIFDILFVLHNEGELPGHGQAEKEKDADSLIIRPYDFETDTSKFDLSFHVVEGADCLNISFEYSTKLFKKQTVERFINYFKKVVSAVLTDQNKTTAEIEIMGEREKQAVIEMSRGVSEAFDMEGTIQRRFEEKAQRLQDAAALVYDYKELSYGDLNRKANQLARFLRTRGVKPDKVVGVMVVRSFEMIIAILAILKAGGAYLAIEPELPPERKKYIMTDCSVDLLLTNYDSRDLPADIPEKIEIIDIKNDQLYRGDDENPGYFNSGSDLLYVVYTSGSTGRPKGSMLEQRTILNLITFQYHYTGIDFSKVLQFASIGFDVSVQEIFSTLLAGGTLYLVDKETRNNVEALFRLVGDYNIKTLFLPTAFLKFIENEEFFITCIPGSVNHIVAAGEQLVVTDGFKQYLRANHVFLHNHYGPSEAHVVTALTLEPGEGIPGLPSIGKPVMNTDIYILDAASHLQPVGIPGELSIGGVQVGRGYLNQPELTAEKFIYRSYMSYRSYRLHFSKKIYKTGDLARWLPDGNIEFLGRMDLQVKIRGYRIELGEIENEIMKIDSIKEAVVIDREDENGQRYLCAYYVPRPSAEVKPDSRELKHRLSGILPDYMIPSFFMQVEKIPLTSNGKVDRRTLPEPQADVLMEDRAVTAPGNLIEEKLAALWSEILGISQSAISIDDTFFQLGGHSLKATLLASYIHKELDANIPLAEIFRTPTIRGLARQIEGSVTDAFKSIRPVEEKEYYDLSSAERRIFIQSQIEETSIVYNIPTIAILEGAISRDRLENALAALIHRQGILRTSFQTINREPNQRIHDPADIEFDVEYHDLHGRQAAADSGEGSHERIIKNFIRFFDLSKAPLMRAGLIKVGEKKHILMVDMHHIVTDGTSLAIFLKELLFLYSGQQLPGLRLQYKDFSEWQKGIRQDKNQTNSIKPQERYWLGRFEGGVPQLDLPTDFPRSTVRSYEGSVIISELDNRLTVKVRELTLETGTTVYMVLLTVFNILLLKYSLQEDIVVGTGVAGRRHADLGNIIGMFVNMLPMRNQPREEKRFAEFLQEVKTTALDAFENQDYQFEELVEKLGIPRGIGRNPIFDAEFTLQNTAVMGMKYEAPGIKITPYDILEAKNTKFDLSLEVLEWSDRLSLVLNYSTALFKSSSAEKMVKHYIEILQQVLENKEIKLRDIRLSHKLSAAPVEINEEETLFGI